MITNDLLWPPLPKDPKRISDDNRPKNYPGADGRVECCVTVAGAHQDLFWDCIERGVLAGDGR